MSTWVGISPVIGAGSLEGFAVGATVTGAFLLAITAPRRLRRRPAAAAGTRSAPGAPVARRLKHLMRGRSASGRSAPGPAPGRGRLTRGGSGPRSNGRRSRSPAPRRTWAGPRRPAGPTGPTGPSRTGAGTGSGTRSQMARCRARRPGMTPSRIRPSLTSRCLTSRCLTSRSLMSRFLEVCSGPRGGQRPACPGTRHLPSVSAPR
jgi:hypothetical protein